MEQFLREMRGGHHDQKRDAADRAKVCPYGSPDHLSDLQCPRCAEATQRTAEDA